MTTAISEKILTRPVMLADAELVANLCNAGSQAALGKDTTNAEELRHEWQSPGFDMGVAIFCFEIMQLHVLHLDKIGAMVARRPKDRR
ncbi:hypothetical protein ACFLYO_05000 [Chloroflexota bacterium]